MRVSKIEFTSDLLVNYLSLYLLCERNSQPLHQYPMDIVTASTRRPLRTMRLEVLRH